jgi:hypothetical protein
MIVELFGPPGSGKTTFADALTARLRESRLRVELKLSWRPTELPPVLAAGGKAGGRYQNAVVHRIARPVREMLTIARHPLANSRDISTAVRLVRRLPPRRIVSSIKNTQYLSRLSHAWYAEENASHIAVFDQAFVQAVCSLALVAGVTGDVIIAAALGCVPRSDLFVRLEAPLGLLKARLYDRWRLQSAAERLLEADLMRSLASVSMIDRLQSILLKQGWPVLRASSLDRESLQKSVDFVANEIIARRRGERLGTSS